MIAFSGALRRVACLYRISVGSLPESEYSAPLRVPVGGLSPARVFVWIVAAAKWRSYMGAGAGALTVEVASRRDGGAAGMQHV